jgi:hypothetical protein
MPEKQIFETKLEKDENSEAVGIYIRLMSREFSPPGVFGQKRQLNNVDHRSTIARKNGKFMIIVPKRFREAAGIKGVGDNCRNLWKKTFSRESQPFPKILPKH